MLGYGIVLFVMSGTDPPDWEHANTDNLGACVLSDLNHLGERCKSIVFSIWDFDQDKEGTDIYDKMQER